MKNCCIAATKRMKVGVNHPQTKKKKRKPHSKKKEDTDESSDVDDRGWTREREAKLATLQAKPQEEPQVETSGGAQEEEEPANGMVEDEEME
jgi:hypothetical protein